MVPTAPPTFILLRHLLPTRDSRCCATHRVLLTGPGATVRLWLSPGNQASSTTGEVRQKKVPAPAGTQGQRGSRGRLPGTSQRSAPRGALLPARRSATAPAATPPT